MTGCRHFTDKSEPMADLILRSLRRDEWLAAAEVICASIRDWYAAAGRPGRFAGGAEPCLVFPEVYEELDPGCCLVAEDPANGRLAGLCFYHPRESHISLGIMSVHPEYFCRGVARQLLRFICNLADRQAKSLRLFSSAMNIDSFSLYTRAGFVPRDVFQVMTIQVPASGLEFKIDGASRRREARLEDIPAMAALECEISGIRRDNDYQCFISNRLGVWHVSVIEGKSGGLDGFLISINHPGSAMLGPGVMRNDADAAVLILAELDRFRGQAPACLVPAARSGLIQQLYAWGLRNSELSLFQSRGHAEPFRGVMMPSFMPETG